MASMQNWPAGTISLKGRLICRSGDECESVLAHLAEHIRLTRDEAGCLLFEVRQSPDPMIFTVNEAFTDKAAFDLHGERARASAWGRATAAIERDFEITLVK